MKKNNTRIIILLFIICNLFFPNLFARSCLKIKSSENNSIVFLDGKVKGSCGENEYFDLFLKAGTHTVKLKKDNKNESYYFYSEEFTIANMATKRISAKMKLKFTETYYHKKIGNKTPISVWERYLKEYPNGRYVSEIKNEINKIEVKIANDMFTEVLNCENISEMEKKWEKYIEKYPRGKYLTKSRMIEMEAKMNAKMEEYVFVEVKKYENILALKEYLKKYPNSKYVSEANDEIKRIQDKIQVNMFYNAKKNKSISELEKYLDEYPNGNYASEAKSEVGIIKDNIEKNMFYNAKKNKSISELEKYLDEYPNGNYASEAKSEVGIIKDNIEKNMFYNAKKNKSVSELKKYLDEYPNGKYASEANSEVSIIKDNIEKNMFFNAKKNKSVSEFEKYSDEYPNGKYASEAKSEISRIRAEIEKMRKRFNIKKNEIFVKGGSFKMGSNNGSSNEKPVHRVTVNDFIIGKYEVTQKEWKAVMGNNPSYFKGNNLPVERVSWNDIQEFLKKLNRKTGAKYRLPTEAEWEYACRGGKSSVHYKYSGSNDIDAVAWYWKNSGDSNLSGEWDYYKIIRNNCKTHFVGTKQPNELGIYDMSGNVGEWCSDWYGEDYYNDSPNKNPKGPAWSFGRVGRGGSWYGNALRVANRYDSSPSDSNSYIGFRLSRTAE